jgi:RNA polymerase sigma-70 factor (TIGR02960 family)
MTRRNSARPWRQAAADLSLGNDGVMGGTSAAAGGRARLLALARSGDQEAFADLVGPYLHELHVHCYRMLGSFQDAEDVMQEVLVRAWQHLGRFERRSSLRQWMYRIATNRCLTFQARAATAQAFGTGPVPPPPNAPDVEVVALQPYPDTRLGALPENDPQARYDLRESVDLAFLAAIQLLPARQRALLLRDVLAFSAAETAGLLDTTVAGVNSALQRGRAALQQHRAAGRLRPDRPAASSVVERSILHRYLAAWRACDIAALVDLLREDALLTMPPFPLAYRGREAIAQFLATVPAGGRLDQITLVPARANRQPAVAAYIRDPGSRRATAYGIMVLTIDGSVIGEITGFADPALFPLFGLPSHLEA